MTFWWSDDNYGQILQCYALQQYLRDLGHEAYLIRYLPDDDIIKGQIPFCKKIFKVLNPKKIYKYISYRIKRKKLEVEKRLHNRQFELFRQKYITQSSNLYITLKELRNNPPKADVYIVGSDQVWNFYSDFKHRKNLVHAYFLDFGSDSTKRMAYAASWGRTYITDEEIAEITPLLKRFNYISVREESGIELCEKCGRQDAKWCYDPTLLLNASIYRKLYKENDIKKIDDRYLFLYMLGNECDFNVQTVYQFAVKKNLKVVYVSGNNLYDNHKKYFATIPEWLYLVDNAEYVITNSFHCGVFSSIFHKQFGIVPLTGVWAGMNERFSSLFGLMEIEERFVSSGKFDILEKEYQPKDLQNNVWFN